MDDSTTVKIKKETRDQLAELGTKKETYDQIIQRLIECYKRNRGEKQ